MRRWICECDLCECDACVLRAAGKPGKVGQFSTLHTKMMKVGHDSYFSFASSVFFKFSTRKSFLCNNVLSHLNCP